MATITSTQIKKEAEDIIKNIFAALLKSDDKENWKKAFALINKRILILEEGERGLQMFAWREVLAMLNAKYGAKFITKKS